MKRITVSRMLTKRLSDSKLMLDYDYSDIHYNGGGQYRANLKKDIAQLEFLIQQLKEFKTK